MAYVLGLDIPHSYEEVASRLKNYFYSSLPTSFKKNKTKSQTFLSHFIWKNSREDAQFLYNYLVVNVFIQDIIVLRSIFTYVWGRIKHTSVANLLLILS